MSGADVTLGATNCVDSNSSNALECSPIHLVLIRLRARNIRVGPTLPDLKTPPLN